MTGRRFLYAFKSRQGFTLVEVLLTLCLLVIITSMAWPLLDKPFASQRLLKAADQIRAEWGSARVEALNSGLTYTFQYTIQGNQFCTKCQAAPETPSDAEAEYGADYGNDSLARTAVGQDAANPLATENTLPEKITFVGGETAADTRAATVESQSQTVFFSDASWSQPILFFPDGTTSTARLILKNQHGRRIELTMRGLTGVVKVGQLYSDEDGLR